MHLVDRMVDQNLMPFRYKYSEPRYELMLIRVVQKLPV
jgi:hypothetical protein